MREDELFVHSVSEEEDSLQQLHYWLKYEGLTFLAGGFSFWVPYGLVVRILFILAAIFTPYMLWHLIRARWYKSVAIFVLFVLLPFTASFFVSAEASLTKFLLMAVPLAWFYIYTWVLRLVIGEHLSETRSVRLLNYERRRNAVWKEFSPCASNPQIRRPLYGINTITEWQTLVSFK